MKAETSRPYPALADVALLEHVFRNEEEAWQELMRRFRSLIYRCIGKVLCRYQAVLTNDDVEEIFSEVWVNLLRDDMKKLRCYDPARGSKLGSWIGLISINTAYDHLRVTARQPVLDHLDGAPEREDSSPSPLEQLLDKERWAVLGDLSKEFSPRDRCFMELYFRRGIEPAEIARLMHISVKTVYSKKNKIWNRLLAAAQSTRQAALAA